MNNQTALQKTNDDAGAIMERVLIVGDLAKLTPNERVSYYNHVCQSVGLNPLTRPFSYLVLSGKLTLYANKDCSEQLRKNNRVSIYKIEKEQDGELYIVTAYARTADGREDVDMGAVDTATAKGDNLVNARLKAVTKAKRRVTLSICGLGFLDESEVETIPDAHKVKVADSGEIIEAPPATVHAFPQQPVIEASPSPYSIVNTLRAAEIRALAYRKGKDADKALAKKGMAKLEELTVDEAEKIAAALIQLPDAEPATEQRQTQRTPAQQKIRLFWDELKLNTQQGAQDFFAHLETKGIEFNSEVSSEMDIPEGLGKGYANALADRLAVKDDPLI